jgi:hypothetical protein
MPKEPEKSDVNIAKIVYDYYPHSDLLPIDPQRDCRDLGTLVRRVRDSDIGDSLFRFIVVEIVEGGQGTLDSAIRVVRRARDELRHVLGALIRANGGRADDRLASRHRISTQKLHSLVAGLIHSADTSTPSDLVATFRLSDEQVIAKLGPFEVKNASRSDETGYDVISDHASINVPDLQEAQRLCEFLNAICRRHKRAPTTEGDSVNLNDLQLVLVRYGSDTGLVSIAARSILCHTVDTGDGGIEWPRDIPLVDFSDESRFTVLLGQDADEPQHDWEDVLAYVLNHLGELGVAGHCRRGRRT